MDVEHWRGLGGLGAGELRAAATAARASTAPDRAAALLRIARAAELASEYALRADILSELDATGPDDLEVTAELAIDAARDGESDRAQKLAESVLDTDKCPPRLRGRALYALGTVSSWQAGSAAKVRAEALLGEAATLLNNADENEWAAGALVTLGIKVHYLNGDLDAALDRLEEALHSQPEPSRFRGITLTFLADAYSMVGRADAAEAAAREAREIGRRFGDRRVLAYAAWGAAMAAAVRRDPVTLLELVTEVERHPGDWYQTPTGAEFIASAADLLGRIASPAAESWLDRAEAASEAVGYPEIALLARAAHEARVGDPDKAAPLLRDARASDEVPPREHWRILLLEAMAASRRGDNGATALLALSRAAAGALGHPRLPEIHEPTVVAALDGDGSGAHHVQVLGRFAVTRGNEEIALDSGQSRGLVALLAVAGGERSVDEVIDALWPDATEATARSRLRGLLHRLRDAAEGLVRRDGDTLRLAADIDLKRFEIAARRALSAAGPDRLEFVREALAAYGGELLPADRYADWSATARERVHRLYVSVLDLAARVHIEADQLDEALAILDLAITAEPLDEARYLIAASLARGLGNEGTARRYDARAAEVRRELGL